MVPLASTSRVCMEPKSGGAVDTWRARSYENQIPKDLAGLASKFCGPPCESIVEHKSTGFQDTLYGT